MAQIPASRMATISTSSRAVAKLPDSPRRPNINASRALSLADDRQFYRVHVAFAERRFDGGNQREEHVECEDDREKPEGEPWRRPARHGANQQRRRYGVLEIERLLRLVG